LFCKTAANISNLALQNEDQVNIKSLIIDINYKLAKRLQLKNYIYESFFAKTENKKCNVHPGQPAKT
jgi:hypothetical protein